MLDGEKGRGLDWSNSACTAAAPREVHGAQTTLIDSVCGDRPTLAKHLKLMC
jgi:hypothetical protein